MRHENLVEIELSTRVLSDLMPVREYQDMRGATTTCKVSKTCTFLSLMDAS